jgi:hypothetical protein
MGCKGMLPNCVTDIGCIFLVSLPAPDLTLVAMTAWSSVIYDKTSEGSRGRTIKPELAVSVRLRSAVLPDIPGGFYAADCSCGPPGRTAVLECGLCDKCAPAAASRARARSDGCPLRSGLAALSAQQFNATLAHSDGVPFAALAKQEGVSRSYFTRVVRLSYLAPDITEAILDGRQPRDLTAQKLLAHSRLPLGWHDQRTALGFV